MTFLTFRRSTYSRLISFCLMVTFVTSMVITPRASYAQEGVLGLPEPGTMVNLSSAYVPMMITGLTIHPENPLLMDFIVNTGNTGMDASQVKVESDRLIKYFLACLTIPENNKWVNLSPYEKDRIIPDDLGKTVLGQDMLAQDYLLKQLSASLIYPEKNLGKNFWEKVYSKASQLYGTTQIPLNTFNKVWILPDTAQVYEHKDTVFVVKSHLKVMLDADYLSLTKHNSSSQVNNLGSQVVRQVILPAIEQEVNTGKNFAQLRQIYNSMILALWFKKNLKQALLNQVYTDKSKVNGVNVNDPAIKNKIYQQYLEAYKKGVFNYIKEEVDQSSRQVIPRKYFSGGLRAPTTYTEASAAQAMSTLSSTPGLNFRVSGLTQEARASAPPVTAAMSSLVKSIKIGNRRKWPLEIPREDARRLREEILLSPVEIFALAKTTIVCRGERFPAYPFKFLSNRSSYDGYYTFVGQDKADKKDSHTWTISLFKQSPDAYAHGIEPSPEVVSLWQAIGKDLKLEPIRRDEHGYIILSYKYPVDKRSIREVLTQINGYLDQLSQVILERLNDTSPHDFVFERHPGSRPTEVESIFLEHQPAENHFSGLVHRLITGNDAMSSIPIKPNSTVQVDILRNDLNGEPQSIRVFDNKTNATITVLTIWKEDQGIRIFEDQDSKGYLSLEKGSAQYTIQRDGKDLITITFAARGKVTSINPGAVEMSVKNESTEGATTYALELFGDSRSRAFEPLKGKVVFLLESEPGIRDLMREVLERSGLRVVSPEEGDGDQRILDILESENKFDLIMIDQVREGKSGVDLWKTWSSKKDGNAQTPTIFFSGYEKEEIARAIGIPNDELMQAGQHEPASTHAYLPKPVDLVILKGAIIDMINANKAMSAPIFELNNPVGHEDYWLEQTVSLDDLVEDMFRDYDYRYEKKGKDLNPAIAFRLGLVWAKLALEKAKRAGITNRTVLITRDARKANPEIMDALVSAMRYSGLDVVYTAADTSNAVTSYSWAVQQFKPLMSIFHTASHVSRPDDTFVRGFKVAIMDEIGGGVKSLTTKEIKQTTLPEVKKLLESPSAVLALRGDKLGDFRAENIDKNCIRFNVLVGLIAASNGSLYDFGEDLRKSDDPLSILEKYEGIYASVKPLKGIKVVVDGSHTQSGYLAAETFKGLGAEVVEMNIDIQDIWGPHNADPSIKKNVAGLEAKIKETGAHFGLSFDLDGDRGAIIVPESKGELHGMQVQEFHNLAPDNLLGVLLPPLIDQWGYKQSGKQLAIIRDVLGTHAVNDKGAELKIPVYQTDAGYPFLKAKKQALEKEGVVVPMYGERSGHTWLHVSGEIENPLAVAVLFAILAKQKLDAQALNPVYDVYKKLSVPYSQSPRFQPLFHPNFLTQLGNSPDNPTTWRYNPSNPTNPPQVIIGLGKDLGIKLLQQEFTVGKGYETTAGNLKVKEFNSYADPADEGGLNRYADIVFEQDGKFAGRFVFRASSNDPTFVTSYEAPQWGGEDIQATNKRKAIVAQLVLNFLRKEKIALVTKDEIAAAMPHLTTDEVGIVYSKSNLAPVEDDLNNRAMKTPADDVLPKDEEDVVVRPYDTVSNVASGSTNQQAMLSKELKPLIEGYVRLSNDGGVSAIERNYARGNLDLTLQIVKRDIESIEFQLSGGAPITRDRIKKIDDLIADIRSGKFKLKGESADILKPDQQKFAKLKKITFETFDDGQKIIDSMKVNGNLDRGVAEKLGYFHQTANAIVRTPDRNILVQTRALWQSFGLFKSIYGGHLTAGMNHFEGISEELDQELNLKQEAKLKGKLRFSAFDVYDEKGVDNKEVRSLFVYDLDDSEWAKIKLELEKLQEARYAAIGALFSASNVDPELKDKILAYFKDPESSPNLPAELKDILGDEVQAKRLRPIIEIVKKAFLDKLKANGSGLGEVWDFTEYTWEQLSDQTNLKTYTPDLLGPLMTDSPSGGDSLKDKLKRTIDRNNQAGISRILPEGGIDLSSRTLKLQSEGQKVDITFNPAMMAQFERGDFSGVKFRVLEVARINLNSLLGLK